MFNTPRKQHITEYLVWVSHENKDHLYLVSGCSSQIDARIKAYNAVFGTMRPRLRSINSKTSVVNFNVETMAII